MDERQRSQIFLRRAFAYSKATQLILAGDQPLLDLVDPLAQLQCQTAEITIKAFLLHKGSTTDELAKLGHDLARLARRAILSDLPMSFDELRQLLWINRAYSSHAMRYGPVSVPVSLNEPRSFQIVVSTVLERVDAICNGKSFDPVTRRVAKQDVDIALDIIRRMYENSMETFLRQTGQKP